ncbi:hypothetical protein NXS08_01015 [Gleimia sp. 6138-11-ORH1]|uniref:hypothetical protein n=1 Tax=Gleimia sp. 6138-11-ORH1 TaxID=2973937 RepID=UPI0021674474|nr:hypothetical protein [Gleimia sp. 6138-11-ORH1]MCS4484073.1 hypothetical protein [Gleimia sp. 6138-11-ORH1]
MSSQLPDLTAYFAVELPYWIQEITAAKTFQDLFIWQTKAEDQRWDEPFDTATELLETDPEACFDQCTLALESIAVEFPVINEFFTELDQTGDLSKLKAIPLYCENLAARLLISQHTSICAEIPFVRIPDIAVRGRLWLANQCALGKFPHLKDPLVYAFNLVEQANLLAPGDADTAALRAIFAWQSDAPVKLQMELLADLFEVSLTAEQLSYAYYVAALLRSGTPDALACYAQVQPSTAFYEDALNESIVLKAELEIFQPNYEIPDYTAVENIFNFMNGSTQVPHPVPPGFPFKSQQLLQRIFNACHVAQVGEALEAFRTYDRLS